MAAKKVIQGNPLSFRPSLGIFSKEISKILAKRSSLELLVLLLMNIYIIIGIRDMLCNCFKTKERKPVTGEQFVTVRLSLRRSPINAVQRLLTGFLATLRFALNDKRGLTQCACHSAGVPSMQFTTRWRDSSLRFVLNDKRGLLQCACHSAGVPST